MCGSNGCYIQLSAAPVFWEEIDPSYKVLNKHFIRPTINNGTESSWKSAGELQYKSLFSTLKSNVTFSSFSNKRTANSRQQMCTTPSKSSEMTT